MSPEERSEFLLQSIESHDRRIGELTESIQSHDRQIAELTDGLTHTRSLWDDFIAESREGTKEMKLAISRLATAMHG